MLFRSQLSDDDFVKQISSNNGCVQLPSGLIFQWGQATLPATGNSVSNVAVTFTRTFSSAPYSITTSFEDQPDAGWGQISTCANAPSTTGFNFKGDTGSGADVNQKFTLPVTVFWQAIGPA